MSDLVKRLRDGCNLQQRDGERAADRIESLEAEVTRLSAVADAFKELLAIVEGECPSLVNEDSGANQVLIDLLVRAEEANEWISR